MASITVLLLLSFNINNTPLIRLCQVLFCPSAREDGGVVIAVMAGLRGDYNKNKVDRVDAYMVMRDSRGSHGFQKLLSLLL
jgi:hypothetical protein